MKNRFLFVLTAIIMFILGASDSLRSIFSPLFTENFNISVNQLGVIVSASYMGNIIFLITGGIILDKFDIKKCQITFLILLIVSEAILMISNNFLSLATGFFLTLGLSTLLNTTINLYSDRFSDTKGLMFINILFFIQGIGSSLSQYILSKQANNVTVWHTVLLIFIIILIPITLLLSKAKGLDRKHNMNIPSPNTSDHMETAHIVLLTLTLCTYLIAEHGAANYMILWGGNELGKDAGTMGTFLALFSAGIMIGRLVFSPFIDKFNESLIILIALILAGINEYLVFAHGLLPLTIIMGLSCSIVYPTLVAMVRRHVPSNIASRATTIVIGLASAFDITFNMTFGNLIEHLGYSSTMIIVSASNFIGALTMIPLVCMSLKRKTQ